MDRSGNLAIGYSIGGAGAYPSIAYAGRLAHRSSGRAVARRSHHAPWQRLAVEHLQPVGRLQHDGGRSHGRLHVLDTTEYIATTGTTTRQTRIGSFRFDQCTSGSASASAAFVKLDETTQGTWQGSYGGDGGVVIADAANYPAHAQVTPTGIETYTWEEFTSDVRALERMTAPTRLAATWYGSALQIDVNLTDGQPHQVAMYSVDWEDGGRAQRVEVRDATNWGAPRQPNAEQLCRRTVSGVADTRPRRDPHNPPERA
jgi:hypothetical protein